MLQPPGLTRNQALVLEALLQAEGPLSAYMLLAALKEAGLRAPLQVYRALDKLIAYGLAHRIESLNAFVACNHPGDERDSVIAFAICDACGQVTEFPEHAIERRLKRWSRDHAFKPGKLTVEMRGLCGNCQKT